MDLAKRIKRIREEKGLKQYEVADKIGLERANYTRLENRGNKMTLEQLQQIADALDITLKELLFSEKSTKSEKEFEFMQRELDLLKREKKIEEKEFDVSLRKSILHLLHDLYELGWSSRHFREIAKTKGYGGVFGNEKDYFKYDDLLYIKEYLSNTKIEGAAVAYLNNRGFFTTRDIEGTNQEIREYHNKLLEGFSELLNRFLSSVQILFRKLHEEEN